MTSDTTFNPARAATRAHGSGRILHRQAWRAAGVAVALGLALSAGAQHATHGTAQKKRPPPLAMGAAFSPSGDLWIVALDSAQKLFVQTSSDEGKSWSEVRTLSTGTDKIAADGENRPKITFGHKGHAVITYTEPLAKPYTGQIRMLRSADGGQSFSPPFTVHQDRQLITHRFESVAFDAQGTLHTVWVDKRDLEAQKERQSKGLATGEHRSDQGGKQRSDYRGAAIYRNESRDGGQTFGPDIKVADHSCECCRIALAPAPDGGVVALWRHVFAPNERDHAFAPLSAPRSASQSVPLSSIALPVRATFDHWAIDACPHHGPGLAPARGGGYHAVWFGNRAGDARVRYGQLHADGTPRDAAQALPDERAEHATVLTGTGTASAHVVVAWRSFDGKATRWRAWVSGDDGKTFSLQELGSTTEDNDHPLLLNKGSQVFALWRTAQGVRVARITPPGTL